MTDFANLVAGDTNKAIDTFLRDTVANTTVRVSVTNSGAQTTQLGFGTGVTLSSVSNDGKRVAFVSSAKEYLNETELTMDAWVRDLAAKTTTLVSINQAGRPVAQAESVQNVMLSGDGKFVTFDTTSPSIVAGDTGGFQDAFVRNLAAATTARVSVSSNGTGGNNHSFAQSISANGSAVGFVSQASNLVAGDTNNQPDAFARRAGQTVRVNVSSSGTQGNNKSICSMISQDGRFVAFCSQASNLVPGDTNGKVDAFVRDLQAGKTLRVSVSENGGAQANDISPYPAIGADGRYVAFMSDASNLVQNDTNAKRDAFVVGPLY